jgi:hypothetical protein
MSDRIKVKQLAKDEIRKGREPQRTRSHTDERHTDETREQALPVCKNLHIDTRSTIEV